MRRDSLTQYDEYPKAMIAYLRNYGPHFNKKLCEFAAKNMTAIIDGEEKPIRAYSKEEVESILNNYGITLKNNQLHDEVYVANMCKADFLGKSVQNESYLALYVRDVIDDVDAPDGLLFNRWYADMCYKGIAIEWEDML